MEKDKATHSSILAWRIPWTEEPDELQFMGSRRVRHDWSELAHMYACCSRYQSISFKAEQHSTVWTPSICDACSGVSRFWLLWIVLLRTCGTRTFVSSYFQPSGVYTQEWNCWVIWCLCFTFWGTAKLLSRADYSFFIPCSKALQFHHWSHLYQHFSCS